MMETTHRMNETVNLTFAIKDNNGNVTFSIQDSPDSLRSNSSRDGSDSSQDVEMEDCLGSPADNETPFSDAIKSCGSCENFCSMSSGEMVMRSNSLTVEDPEQQLIVSLMTEPKSLLDISPENPIVFGMLPDVCEGLGEVPKEDSNLRSQILECTHIQQNNQTFLVDYKVLSAEKAGCGASGLHNFSKGGQKFPCSSGEASQSVESKLVLCAATEDLNVSGGAQTSTPVQSLSNKTFCLLNLSESLLDYKEADSESPIVKDVNQPKQSTSQKAKTSNNKIEIKRFPKPNFGNIKSKIISHATNAFKTSNSQVPKISLSSTSSGVSGSQSMDQSNKSASALTNTSATPAKSVKSSIAPKRTYSTSSQGGGPASSSRPRRWSESSTSSKVNKAGSHGTTPQKNIIGDSQNKAAKNEKRMEETQGSEAPKVRGKIQRVGLMALSGRLGPQPAKLRTGASTAAASQGPVSNLRPPLSASKTKPLTTGKDSRRTSDSHSPRRKLSISEAPQSASKLPMKLKFSTKCTGMSQTSKNLNQEPAAGSSQPSNKGPFFKSKLQCPSSRSASAGSKATPLSSTMRSASTPLKTPFTPRTLRAAATPTVEKNRQPSTTNGQPDLVPDSKARNVEYFKAQCERKNPIIQQLENTFRSSSRCCEALAVVIKHLHAEHESSMKQRRDLTVELVTLREELVSSAHSCERLESEKEELRMAFDGVLQKLQEQHRLDLAELEERLKTFYSSEWEKVHRSFQEETDECKVQMQEQLEEIQSKQEMLRKQLETSHSEEVDSLKQQFEESFQELKQCHVKEMDTFNKALKESEESLSDQIQELSTENNSLKEKLNSEMKRRLELAEKGMDSHTLYLEQELESLKVVLDIKNKQIHEQETKLLQIGKLTEQNVKLDECLKKLQQENEDLKARMDRHAALSRQLSSEQAVLQESLQKESKVNKRLSMENEELLWKLHNGDSSSPRRISPSPSLNFPSPRASAMFSSPPLSPR